MATKPRTVKRTSPHQGWTRLEYLVDALAQLEAQVRAAEADKSWNAAVNAKHRALMVRAEIDQLRETERRQVAPADVVAHKGEILSEVRRLRTGATEAGSYVAAAQLLRLERELLTVAEDERRTADAERLAHVSDDDLRAEAEELFADLDNVTVPKLRVVPKKASKA